ncbi:hypothetical protein AMTRI_Chr01g102690 [Amborella trichopoda]
MGAPAMVSLSSRPSLSYSLSSPPHSFTPHFIFSPHSSSSVLFSRFKSFSRRKLLLNTSPCARFRPVNASSIERNPTKSEGKWLLEPVGDGDSRHIGYKVPLPDAFEIASNVVTVGRLAEKADMVIPVATVSGLHARLEKREGNLMVTDLDSTNGTYINEKRLNPGISAAASPGSCIVFGDTHLAAFRLLKLESEDEPSEPETPKAVLETVDLPNNS